MTVDFLDGKATLLTATGTTEIQFDVHNPFHQTPFTSRVTNNLRKRVRSRTSWPVQGLLCCSITGLETDVEQKV